MDSCLSPGDCWDRLHPLILISSTDRKWSDGGNVDVVDKSVPINWFYWIMTPGDLEPGRTWGSLRPHPGNEPLRSARSSETFHISMTKQKQAEVLGSTLLRREPPVTPDAPDHVHGRYRQTFGSGLVRLTAGCKAASGITSETEKVRVASRNEGLERVDQPET